MKQLPITNAEVWGVPAEQLNEALSKLGDGNWTVLGTATKDLIDFDADALGMTESELRKLIELSGYFFTNPLGNYELAHKRHILTGTWQEAQRNVIEKLVIIRKV